MLNERGGVVDDLIIYFGDEQHFRVVVNAGTRDKDIAWLKRWAEPFKVDIQPRTDLAMVAVQGPNARAKAAKVIGKSAEAVLGMKPFFSRQLDCISSRAPATPAKTAAKSSCRRRTSRRSGRRCATPASASAASARATRCGSKPA